MNDISEKMIPQKVEGKWIAYRVGIILGTVAVSLLGVLLAIGAKNPIPVIILVPLALVFGVRVFWGMTSIEFEISVMGDVFTLARIYGKRRRKTEIECEIASIQLLAPDNEENRMRAERMEPQRFYRAYGSEKDEGKWLLVFEEEKNVNAMLVLTAEEELVKRVRFRKPSAVSFR